MLGGRGGIEAGLLYHNLQSVSEDLGTARRCRGQARSRSRAVFDPGDLFSSVRIYMAALAWLRGGGGKSDRSHERTESGR